MAKLVACFCLLALVAGSKVSPMQKVITMLEDLQAKVLVEGSKESQTYDKFACFCKDMSAEKADAITEGGDAVMALEASIGQLTAQREDLDDASAGHEEDILQYVKEMKAEVERRKEEYGEYIRERRELKAGQEDLGKLMKELQSPARASLVQIKDLQSALTVADSLGMTVHPKTLAFVQEAPATAMLQTIPAEIFDTLKTLNDGFDDKIKQVKHDEQMNNHEHEMFMDNHNMDKKISEKDLAEVKKQKSAAMEALGKDNKDLTEASATLMDDKAYIQALTSVCNKKAREWDQRTTMRQNEITALGNALHVLKESQSEPEEDTAFTQEAKVAKPAVTGIPEEDSEEEVDELASKEDEESLIQVASPRHRLAAVLKKNKAAKAARPSTGTDARSKIIMVATLLKERGAALKSDVLLRIASQAKADSFGKIKTLIQELIERLLQEAADEANQKGWCDREMGKAKKGRKQRSNLIKKSNEKLAENEVKRDKLVENIADLSTEIDELNDSLSKLSKERSEESAENAATIEEATAGRNATQTAVKVLSEFYGTPAPAVAAESLLQKSASREIPIPDAGFDGAYKGAGAGTGGIMGMLEVIISDFDREISVATKNELQGAKEFQEVDTQTKISTGTKAVTKEAYEAELIEVNGAIQDDKTTLSEEQALLDKTLQELGELRPACVDTGMSYEEKIAKREDEMKSLKEALGILEDSSL